MKNDFATASTYDRMPFTSRATQIPVTVLRRAGGSWQPIEVTLLRTHLNVSVIGNPVHPEVLLLRGHFEKYQTLPVMLDGNTYTVEKFPSQKSEGLPFRPAWF